jgi:hypothetical protein
MGEEGGEGWVEDGSEVPKYDSDSAGASGDGFMIPPRRWLRREGYSHGIPSSTHRSQDGFCPLHLALRVRQLMHARYGLYNQVISVHDGSVTYLFFAVQAGIFML